MKLQISSWDAHHGTENIEPLSLQGQEEPQGMDERERLLIQDTHQLTIKTQSPTRSLSIQSSGYADTSSPTRSTSHLSMPLVILQDRAQILTEPLGGNGCLIDRVASCESF